MYLNNGSIKLDFDSMRQVLKSYGLGVNKLKPRKYHNLSRYTTLVNHGSNLLDNQHQ